jgi:hypothetical protein
MGKRNYLVEGGSGTGKSAVWAELLKRGYTAVNGDRELAYQGDPETGERTDTQAYGFHIWDVARVREIVQDTQDDVVFFCGGSRNFSKFLDLFDGVFVLTVDADTLKQRIAGRAADDWGGNDEQKDFILRLHARGGDVPDGTIIDTRRPLSEVVDTILRYAEA